VGLMSVEEALSRVLAHAEPLPAQSVPLAEAHGRVLAADLEALRTQPPADVSAMDGYAVRAADTFGATEALPAYLTVIGESPMGSIPTRSVDRGEAIVIHTGGMLPDGADAVVMLDQERLGHCILPTLSSRRTPGPITPGPCRYA